ncbi:MAG: bifunctional adenosylcobinamide kinase/adenosylcobinamide-phosphate guanylyltransferase, partial [Planctomycetaceae bacterium]
MNDAIDPSGKLVLILGGVRSGKSRFGQELARELGGDDVWFVATAEARDEEMSRRIDKHRLARPSRWRTLEQPLGVANAMEQLVAESIGQVILLDCLTLLVSNIVLQDHTDHAAAEQRMRTELEALVRVVQKLELTLIVVSGEVGMGLVPETPIG